MTKRPLTKEFCRRLIRRHYLTAWAVTGGVLSLFFFLYLCLFGQTDSALFLLVFLLLTSVYYAFRLILLARGQIVLVRDTVDRVKKRLSTGRRSSEWAYCYYFRRYGKYRILRSAGLVIRLGKKNAYDEIEDDALQSFAEGEEFYLLLLGKKIVAIFSVEAYEPEACFLTV